MQAVVLAAGKGTRMRSSRPKVLHEILGQPMLTYVWDSVLDLGIRKPRFVIGSGQVRSFIIKYAERHRKIRPRIVLQRSRRGTGHAVMVAECSLRHLKEDILVWPGDMPLVKASTIWDFIRHHRKSCSEASVLSCLSLDPMGYGRIVRAGGRFCAIREELDATTTERRIQEINTGIYLFKARCLFPALRKIRPENKKKEYYLTDTIELLSKDGHRIEAFPLASEEETRGINSRQDLAKAVKIMRNREIQYHQERGVTFIAPDQTFLEPDVQIGRDTVIHPWCYIESGVRIGRGCKIGPFARIRKGTRIEDGAVIGSFVEVNRSRIGRKVLAKHHAYLGDAVVGEGTNIGAGTITANFDGKRKNRTRIGKKVLVGSNTVFVAPVDVGDHVKTGAGSVITARMKIKKGQVVVGVPARVMKKKKGS